MMQPVEEQGVSRAQRYKQVRKAETYCRDQCQRCAVSCDRSVDLPFGALLCTRRVLSLTLILAPAQAAAILSLVTLGVCAAAFVVR